MCNLYVEKAYYRKNIKNMTNGKAKMHFLIKNSNIIINYNNIEIESLTRDRYNKYINK